MKVQMTVDERETGNPSRGYHNFDATVTFEYPEPATGTYSAEKEIAIVKSITAGNWMWHTVKGPDVEMRDVPNKYFPATMNSLRSKAVYRINYGYDSGD